MRIAPATSQKLQQPALLAKAELLACFIRTLSSEELQKVMGISPALAEKTKSLFLDWTADSTLQSLAIDSFRGDIFSGLQADTLSITERDYADKHLRILSGLYGVIRPYDGILPYRLEMAYQLPDSRFRNLYQFWSKDIAVQLPSTNLIVNLASLEYSQAVLPYLTAVPVVTPRFLSLNPKTNQPTFVVVHAKIARGAFARWLLTSKASIPTDFPSFNELGYSYVSELSQELAPVFVCKEFGGKGLSVRLT